VGAGAGQPPEPRQTAKAEPSVNLVPDGYGGRFRTRATVLEGPRSGPQLCVAVMESYPPQCSGPPIEGWDWSTVRAESASGTTWGAYVLTGTYDGTTFTLTEPARPVREEPTLGPPLTSSAPLSGALQPID
jgi:hypothetical protein